MKIRRHAPLTLFAVLAITASGCRSNGFGSLTRPAPIPTTPGFEVQEVVTEHNRTAAQVTSYQAEPGISMKPQPGKLNMLGGAARGKLYVEQPRNFRLILRAGMQEQFDVGSNNERFWVWSPATFGKVIYTCNYDESGAVPLSSLYQPDWIMEAMGLAALPEIGSEGVTVRSDGSDAVIEQRRTGPDGQIAIKETVISGLTRRITEHRLHQLDTSGKKELVARAVVGEYKKYVAQVGIGDEETLELPASFRLIWPAEQLDLKIQLDQVKINAGFDQDQHSRLFTLPDKPGSKQQDLRAALGKPSEPIGTTIRETRPAPPSGRGVHLSEPVPAVSQESQESQATTTRISHVRRTEIPVYQPLATETPQPAVSDTFVSQGLPRPPSARE